jgi:putative nucleotidyltransferase with HDIG domain
MTDIAERQAFYFQPLDLTKLCTGVPVTFDLYVRAENGFVLYRRRDVPFNATDISRLSELGLHTLYIHNNDVKNFRLYLEDHANEIMTRSDVPVEHKAEVLYDSSVQAMEDLFHQPRSTQEITRAEAASERAVPFILKSVEALPALLEIRERGQYTFNHSVNVAMLLIAMARYSGLDDPELLRQIGLGGILHDLGKSQIPEQLINKIGGLSATEREAIKQHPLYGLELAGAAGIESEIVLAIIGQHHEKYDGSGYPEGLKGNAINVYARMACIVDVYDAMTSTRSYSAARPPVEALKIMMEAVREFDENLLAQFIRMITLKSD